MNYLAHARNVVDFPARLVGTALPDWLSACDRRARLSRERLVACAASDDAELREVAAGALLHLEEDAWFHVTEAFGAVQGELAVRLRAACPPDRRLRASFLGHILLEMLLDAHLMTEEADLLDRYYASLARIDAGRVAAMAGLLVPRSIPGLAALIERFRAARFLYGYRDDLGLLARLNGLLFRIRQPPLPDAALEVLPGARALVSARAGELLSPPLPKELPCPA